MSTSTESATEFPGRKPQLETHQYGEHSLQRVDVWKFANRAREDSGVPPYWVMYVFCPCRRGHVPAVDTLMTADISTGALGEIHA